MSGDEFCRRVLKKGAAREALGWVRESASGSFRTIGEQDDEHSLTLVQRLYAAGATKVWAAEIEDYPGEGQSTNHLVVELPSTDKEREALFRLEAAIADNGGFDPTPDDGQTLMYLGAGSFDGQLSLEGEE